MIERNIEKKLTHLASKFPIVTLTGIRQCGKSTLLRNCFDDYRYVSLEDIDIRQMAQSDPRGFLQNFPSKTIIDEAQYAPELFSYLQTRVDEVNDTGMYILSGSHNFLLLESVSQSLAGRTAVLRLAPLSVSELTKAKKLPATINEWLFTGGFPRIYDKGIAPTDYFPSYIQTYIERDVRMLKNIGNLSAFTMFIKLCAARIGQLLNIQSIATACGITVNTANSWLSILETSYVVFLLKPYYRNFNKRLVKTPKLYFFDTGLAASLLGMTNSEQIGLHYMRGELFENMVIVEKAKSYYANGLEPQMYFWRDSNQNEVDLLTENGTELHAYEIKSSATMNNDHFKGLKRFAAVANLPVENQTVIYGGDTSMSTMQGNYLSWKEL
ncbi:MAG: ATP-binding protein [Prevotella sp.]|nr:ATP-binding protein [Prevotella sp.]